MEQMILVLHVLVAIAIVALVLIQHGKGADIGATFGSGSSQTVFGSQGSVPFLMKITAILAAVFFTTSICLTYLAQREVKKNNMMNFPTMPTTQSNQKNESKKRLTTQPESGKSALQKPLENNNQLGFQPEKK